MAELVIDRVDNDHALGIMGQIYLGVFRNQIPFASVERQIATQKRILASTTTTLGGINIIEGDCGRMDTKTREIIADWGKQPDFKRVRVANVIEGGGVSGVMLRTVLRAVGLTIPRESRAVVFESSNDGAAWLARQLEGDDSMAADIRAAIESLRSAIGVRAKSA